MYITVSYHQMNDDPSWSIEGFASMTVNPECLRRFAVDCMQWAASSTNLNARLLILREAAQWAQIADVLDCRVLDAAVEVLPDLKSKLN